jgi:hypothetical protein
MFLLFLTLFLTAENAFSKTIFVNQGANGSANGTSWQNAFTTIEQAISNAQSGDIIVVAKGTYRPGNSRSSRYNMKNNVHLIGGFNGNEQLISQANPFVNETIISGEIGNVNDETDNIEQLMRFNKIQTAIIEGFHFRDAYTTGVLGAIDISSSSPTFRFCTFQNNKANGSFSSGGAITISGFDGPAEPYFVSCRFLQNESSVIGGAVHNNNTNCKSYFISCLFAENQAARGGALHNGGGQMLAFNCTFTKNTANMGSASYTTSGNATSHRNDIIWNNTHQSTSQATAKATSSATVIVNYSLIQGGFTGTQNINTNPLFVNNNNNDYRLLENSPARLQGDPAFDYTNYPTLDANGSRRITYKRIDLGAFEFKCLTQDESQNQIKITSCGNYTSPLGLLYSTSGIYSEVYPNENGCDSVVQIDLTIISFDLNITILNQSLVANENADEYQWVDCNDNNKPVAGAIGKSYSPTKSGRYAVKLTKGQCQTLSNCIQFNLDATSVYDISSEYNSWNLYPNPTDMHRVNINNAYKSGTIKITSLSGQLVHSQYLEIGENQLDLTALKPGVYVVQLHAKLEKLVLY